MGTLVVVLGILTIAVVLVRGLLVGLRDLRLARGRRTTSDHEALRAEQRLHQLTQDAVARMLETARRGQQ